MNTRDDNDSKWYTSEISNAKFNFDDPSDDVCLPLFGVKKETVAQVARDARASYKLQTEDDDIDQSFFSDVGVVQHSDAYQSARFKHNESTSVRKERPITATEISKLETEVEMLKRKLKEVTSDKWATLPPKTMILRIITGETFSLDAYKSKEEKLALLDTALKYHDGNAIMTVVMHLKRTLNSSLFQLELMKRPTAMNHYISYLNSLDSSKKYSKLSDTYTMIGRTSEAAILNYKLALRSSDIRSLIDNLRNAHTNHFNRDVSLELESSLITEHISLLELQMKIQAKTLKLPEANTKHLPINSSAISTLRHCCLHHYNVSETDDFSPHNVNKILKFNEKQFVWAAVPARAMVQNWKDIEALLTKKGLFGGAKVKFVIPPKKLLHILYTYKADQQILHKYIEKVESGEEKLKLAKKYKCHPLVVDTLVAMRDRQQLQEYKSNVLPHSTDFIYLQNALTASTIRWKN